MLMEALRKSLAISALTIELLKFILSNQENAMAEEKDIPENLKVVAFEKRPSDLQELKEKAEKLKYQASQVLQNVIPVLDEISKAGLKLEFQFFCDQNGKWHLPTFKLFKEF